MDPINAMKLSNSDNLLPANVKGGREINEEY